MRVLLAGLWLILLLNIVGCEVAVKKEALDLLNNKKYRNGSTFKELASLALYEDIGEGRFHGKGLQPVYGLDATTFSSIDLNEYLIIIPKGRVGILQYWPHKGGSLVKNVYYTSSFIIFIEGLEGVDDQIIQRDLILKYSGTFTYNTALGGTRTIYSFSTIYYDKPEFTKDFKFLVDAILEDNEHSFKPKLWKEVQSTLEQERKDIANKYDNQS